MGATWLVVPEPDSELGEPLGATRRKDVVGLGSFNRNGWLVFFAWRRIQKMVVFLFGFPSTPRVGPNKKTRTNDVLFFQLAGLHIGSVFEGTPIWVWLGK